MGVVLHAHPVRGELHIQRNANRQVVTVIEVTLLMGPLFIYFFRFGSDYRTNCGS